MAGQDRRTVVSVAGVGLGGGGITYAVCGGQEMDVVARDYNTGYLDRVAVDFAAVIHGEWHVDPRCHPCSPIVSQSA